MKKCIVIVFDTPKFANSLNDMCDICGSDIKEICDFDDRWEVFDKYLEDEYKDLELCLDSEGLVYNLFNSIEVYGLVLCK